MNQTNKLVLSILDFKTWDSLYEEVGKVVVTLLKANNTLVIYDIEEKGGIVVIEYLYDDESNPKPYWLRADEAIIAQDYHDTMELESAKDKVNRLQKTVHKTDKNKSGNDGGNNFC